MKTGIYIPGLGQAFLQQNTAKYAARFMRELDQNSENHALKFYLKQEKEYYGDEAKLETHVVSIIKKDGDQEEVFYKFYDFNYAKILTEKFTDSNILLKALSLFGVVVAKLPVVVCRLLFARKDQMYASRFRWISFYTLIMLLILALFGVSLIPSTITIFNELIGEIHSTQKVNELFKLDWQNSSFYSYLKIISLNLVAIFTVIYTIFPSAKDFISLLASEFVSANYYLTLGQQSQTIHGNLDMLIEHISEKEAPDTKLHFHAYSFGSIITLDYIFPLSSLASYRIQNKLESVVTIGCPYDFINHYYPNFFKGRNHTMSQKFHWYNIFSTSDALGTNFRNNNSSTKAEYGINDMAHVPTNIKYEINNANPFSILNFLLLYSLKAHQLYWDETYSGQSCVRSLVINMRKDGILPLT